MDLAEAADRLYDAPPEEFVARRAALVATARAARDRSLAAAIGKLRRPTRSAWLVNRYAREGTAELEALLDLGEALRTAQQKLSGVELRRLSTERAAALATATRHAVELGRAHGYQATEAVRQEVLQTLQAALAEPELAVQVRAGTLTQAQAYGGFGFDPADLVAAAPGSGQAAVPPSGVGHETGAAQETSAADARDPAEPGAEDDDRRAQAERRAAAERRATAERRLAEAVAARTGAAEDSAAATQEATALTDRVASLRRELAAAERAANEADERARAARHRLSEQEDAVRAARSAFDET